MTRLNKVGESLQGAEARKSQVKEVENELGLQSQPVLGPEMRALYKAIFKKLKATPVAPAAPAEPEEFPVIPPTATIGGGGG